jgi:hypothetical protein
MSPAQCCAKKHAKARHRRRLQAQERLARARRQAQHAAEALPQALNDLGLPEDLVTEIAGRLHSQHKLLGKIVGVMCPPLFGCRASGPGVTARRSPACAMGVCGPPVRRMAR